MADEGAHAIGSAIPGHYGAETTGVTLAETKIVSAWNAHGDAREPRFVDAMRRIADLELPTVPNTAAASGVLTALWLGPASWLLVANDALLLTGFDSCRDALNAAGGALFDVSASRVAWTVAGPYAALVLAKSCPLDFHPRAFPAGACAQSVFGRVNALFYKRGASPAFTLLVARSFARDVWRSLCLSASQYGYDVIPARSF